MKRIFAFVFLISFLGVLITPLETLALTGPLDRCKVSYDFPDITATGTGEEVCMSGKTVTATNASTTWGICCLVNAVFKVADIIFNILLALVILIVLLAAYTFLTAGGSPENVNKAKNYIFYAFIGLIIAFLAKAIASLIKTLF